ncbi:MAG: hypothetical protein FWG66_02330 [Spirochaetes bacterium]|nr:hypothetical protein [Spirochaetota bacterium]
MSKNKGLGGIIRSVTNATRTVNDATRAANNVSRTANNLSRGAGGQRAAGQPAANQPAADAPADDSWACVCGMSNTTKFCGGCGKPAPAALQCPSCQWERPAENSSLKFCGNCGAKMEE